MLFTNPDGNKFFVNSFFCESCNMDVYGWPQVHISDFSNGTMTFQNAQFRCLECDHALAEIPLNDIIDSHVKDPVQAQIDMIMRLFAVNMNNRATFGGKI